MDIHVPDRFGQIETGGVMKRRFGTCTLRLAQGDITKQRVDAVVNAANSGLLGGGGVDGAIHRAGGPSIMEECRKIGGCPAGRAVTTGAGDLPARWVIHAVGPIWRGGSSGEAEILASAYTSSLEQARSSGARSVAFPSISTGAYGYPVSDAARVALSAVAGDLTAHRAPEEVVFVLFDTDTLRAYREALEQI
jgi:O-acetyl-ADP-ribose deacetylase (regulator of RNase III)